jgi:molybdate transport system substrate-binding protein
MIHQHKPSPRVFMHQRLKTIFLSLIGFLSLISLSVNAQVLVVHAAAGVKSPLETVAKAFQASSGFSIDLHFDTAGAAQQHYLADDSAQALITTLERIESSKRSSELKVGQLFPFAATVAGIAGKNFTGPAPQNAEELKRLLLNCQSIGISDPARGATVGQHFMKILDQLGIRTEVMAKARLAKDGIQTMDWVKAVEVQLGVTQISEIVQSDASTLIGPFPPPFELTSNYALWLKNPDSRESQALLSWLKSQQGRELLVQQGLKP